MPYRVHWHINYKNIITRKRVKKFLKKKTKKKQTNKTKNTNLNNSISIEGPPRGIIIKEL